MKEKFNQRERRALINRQTARAFIENSFDPYVDKRHYGREKHQSKMTFLEKMNSIKKKKENQGLMERLRAQLRGKQQTKLIQRSNYL